MSGLDVAAGVAGLISLSIGLATSCNDAFEFLAQAQELDNKGTGGPNRRLNWELIKSFLKELERLLTNTSSLREKYGLRIEEFDQRVSSATSAEGRDGGWKGFKKFLTPPGKAEMQEAPTPFTSSTSTPTPPPSSVPTLTPTPTPTPTLHGASPGLRRRLYELLDSQDRHAIRLELDGSLRDIISHSSYLPELEVVKQLLPLNNLPQPTALGSAATLKQLRLRLGIDNLPDEKPPSHYRDQTSIAASVSPLRRLKYEFLSRANCVFPPPTSEVALSKRKKVYIEWKRIAADDKFLRRRFEGLAMLLSSPEKDASFRCMTCLGFLRDPTETFFAFVFHLPADSPPHGLAPCVSSLKDCLSGIEKPSLNVRLYIARALAESILQLHTCGWLHKSIRSPNVLFFQGTGIDWSIGDCKEPYLGGYEYARQAGVGEVIEEIDTAPEIDLYRHPRARGPARAKFRKAFDIYGLGCVLLELALWIPLSTLVDESGVGPDGTTNQASLLVKGTPLLSTTAFEDDWNSPRFCDEFVKKDVAFKTGRTFQEAVDSCLNLASSARVDGDESSLALQKDLVQKLSMCRF